MTLGDTKGKSERISNMKILILCLIISTLSGALGIPPIVRAYARSRADKIIHGRRPGTEKLMNRCISILTWSNKWITTRTELDNQRIIRLRDMLKEMQHPHV